MEINTVNNQPTKLAISTFTSLKDTEPKSVNAKWQSLVTFFTKPNPLENKHDTSLWSPVIYKEGTTRGDANVKYITALVFDFDNKNPVSTDFLTDVWKNMGLEFMIHTTYSHTEQKPAWRAIFPLLNPVLAEEWKNKWKAFEQTLCPGLPDPSKANPSAMFYKPSSPLYCTHYVLHNSGTWLDADEYFYEAPTLPKQSEPSKALNMDDAFNDFNVNGKDHFGKILQELGWSYLYTTKDDIDHWQRPGKQDGTSATVMWYSDHQVYKFKCFTTNAPPLEENEVYLLATAVRHLACDGDGVKTLRFLQRLGYGKSYTIFHEEEEDLPVKTFVKPDVITNDDNAIVNTIKAIHEYNKYAKDNDKLFLGVSRQFTQLVEANGSYTIYDMNPTTLSISLKEVMNAKIQVKLTDKEKKVKASAGEKVQEWDVVDGMAKPLIVNLMQVSGYMTKLKDENGVMMKELPTLKTISPTPNLKKLNLEENTPYYVESQDAMIACPEDYYLLCQKAFKSASKEKALRAYDKIRGIFKDTYFMDKENDFAKTMCAILTPHLIGAFDRAFPWFLITASQPGTGKSELAECIGLLSGEYDFSTWKTEEEFQKILPGVITKGSRALILDNLTGVIKSDTLSVMITQRKTMYRPFRTQDIVSLFSNTMLIGTANNPHIDSDLLSRCVEIALHTNVANPGEKRKNSYNLAPSSYISANREKCIGWVLDIIAYGLSVQNKNELGNLKRFPEWQELVVGILNALDIKVDLAPVKAIDEHLQAWVSFCTEWYSKHKNTWITSEEVVEMAYYSRRDNLRTTLHTSELAKLDKKGGDVPIGVGITLGRQIGKKTNFPFEISPNLYVQIEKKQTSKGMKYCLKTHGAGQFFANLIEEFEEPMLDTPPLMEQTNDIDLDVSDILEGGW